MEASCVSFKPMQFSVSKIDWNIHDNLLNKILTSFSMYCCVLPPKSILGVSKTPQIPYISLSKKHYWDSYEFLLCTDVKRERRAGALPQCVAYLPCRCEDLTLDPKNPYKARNGGTHLWSHRLYGDTGGILPRSSWTSYFGACRGEQLQMLS